MELRDYVRLLRRQWFSIALIVGLALAVGAGATLLATPKYAAHVTFFVTTSSRGDVADTYQGGLFSQQRVKSYVDLLKSERLAKSIIEDRGLNLSPEEVASRIDASVVPDTVLLNATVTDSSPARAQQIASAAAKHFVTLVGTLETPPTARAPAVKVEVIEGPRLESSPVSPLPLRNLALALLLGLVLGIGLTLLRESLDTTVKSADALSAAAKVPTMATIGFDRSARREPLIIHQNPQAPRAEAFRQLRTNLTFIDVDRPMKAIVVTSAVPGEGKSTTTANLAISMAQAGSSVLLIEGDLRRPKVAEYLGLEGAVGLTNVLVGQVDLDTVLQPWGADGLWVLPSGSIPPNPSELLGSQQMSDVLKELKSRFDIVLIDAPPLLPVTDAAVAAAAADGALLIARHGHTTRAQVESAVQTLLGVDAHLIGTVYNMVPLKGRDAYGYTYGYDDRPGSRPKLHEQAVAARDVASSGRRRR